MHVCQRCGGLLHPTTPRGVIGDKVYHVYCKWKIEQKQAEEKKEAEWKALQAINSKNSK